MAYNYVENIDELYHYGVAGMRWGVHKSAKAYGTAMGSGNKERGAKALASLQKHKAKSEAKLYKLQKKRVKLDKKQAKYVEKGDLKAARLSRQAVRLKKKSTGRFVSDSKAFKLQRKATKLEVRAADIAKRSAKAKSMVAKNEKMQNAFKKGISEIDAAMAQSGKTYMKAYERQLKRNK